MTGRTLLLTMLTCLVSIGCATQHNPNEMPDEFSVSELALYTSRASMHSLDFEQYKLLGNRMYQECGVIRRGRPVPVHQQLFDISESEHEELMGRTWEVLTLAHAGEAQFAAPGTSDTMFDPGKLLVSISGNGNTMKVSTNLDSIIEPANQSEKAVQELARLIRALTKPAACGNPSFYGLGFDQ